MKLIRRTCVAILNGLVLIAPPSVAVPDVVVIASCNSPISRLTPEQVADIFLGKNPIVSGIGPVTPIDQVEGSPVRNEFYLKISRKDSAQLSAYWARQIFTGKGEPPAEVGNATAAKRLVASNPYAISYLPRSEMDASVKPILILP